MAIKAHTLQIGSNTWTVNTFTTTKAIEIAEDIITLMGGSLASFLKGAKPQQAEGEIASADEGDLAFSNAVETFVSNLKKVSLVNLTKRLVEDALIDNKKVNFDIDFSGNFGAMKQLIAFILKINYSGFFTESVSV